MVDMHIGTNRKLRRLTVPERWCHVAGVLAVAARAPIRGRLLVGQDDATPSDYAETAGVSIATARSTVAKLRAAGVIIPDPENGCERVHDWEEWNPEPKRDGTAAERMKRFRERRAQRREGPRYEILDRDGNACVVCGSTDRLALDHKIPVSRGGSDDAANLHTLCKACNSSKKDRAFEDWLPERLAALGLRNPASVTRLVTRRNGASVTPGREEKLIEDVANAPSSSSEPDGSDPKATQDDERNCRLLARLAKEHNLKFKVQSKSRWLRDMRLCRERDGNTPEEIERLIRWVFTDKGRDARFWADVIRSPGNLRQHFAQIWAKMEASSRGVGDVEDSAAFLARRGAA